MRKTSILLVAIFAILATSSYAQEAKYRRSSLEMVLIETDKFPNKEVVMKSYENYPFPDKYDNHSVNVPTLNPAKYALTDAEKEAAGIKKGAAAVVGEDAISTKEMNLIIEKYIKEQKLANKLVAKWFNAADGFNMNLVAERGFYNASEMDAAIAKGQARGTASLADAGEELIGNTFVTFTKMNFYENEPIAAAAKEAALLAASQIKVPAMQVAAQAAAEAAYQVAKEGYSVWSKTWLYQLNWNDSIASVFYNELWNNPSALEKSDLFSLKLVGVQNNSNLVIFKIGSSQEELINKATVRNIDNVFAKLQKNYDEFKPKVPVLTASPLTAQVGMKEGLKGGEKFDILEMTINPKTERTEYKKIGVATVDKKLIWDNRYNAGEKVEQQLDANGNEINATVFKGPKKVQPGMLLKQKK